jgi:hypothetical protein
MEKSKENKTGETADNLEKGKQPTVQNKPDDKRVPTVAPDNDSGKPGPSTEKSSKK